MSGRRMAGEAEPVKVSIRLTPEAKRKLDAFTDRFGKKGPRGEWKDRRGL